MKKLSVSIEDDQFSFLVEKANIRTKAANKYVSIAQIVREILDREIQFNGGEKS